MPSWLHALLLPLLLSPFSQEDLGSEFSNLLNHHHHHKLEDRKERVTAKNGAVAADDARCSSIGRNALRDGGNAVDAAVATALCLGVVSPASSGIGGGAFILVRLANGTVQAFDSRETAPLNAFKDMYEGDKSKKQRGPLSVAVPGLVAGLYEAWKMHGKLTWESLVRPAQQLADRGFKISPYLYTQMKETREKIFEDEGLKRLFVSNMTNDLLQEGDLVVNERLARTLSIIAESRAQGFYEGSIAKALVKDIKNLGGIITLKDLKSYRVKIRDPIVADFGALGLKIIGFPPPGSGPLLILLSNMLEQFGFPEGISGSLGMHRLIEALKFSFAQRMKFGDPDFVNVTQVVADMLSPKFAAKLKARVSDYRTFDPSYYGGKGESNIIVDHGTTHLSVVDAERNAVSMTSTINSYFGAKILSPSTGIVLNNEMDDFSIPLDDFTPGDPPPTLANFIAPGKRPLSSMSPTIVLENGKLSGVFGASGGAWIVSAVTQVFLNNFFKRMDPMDSVITPRIYHKLYPNTVQFEKWDTVTGDHIEVAAELRADLENKQKHNLSALTSGGAVIQFIKVQKAKNGNQELLVAVSDPRKGGVPAGY